MTQKNDSHWFVAIGGNIGSGKSSLAKLLEKRLGWTSYMESVADNPYLHDFYSNMKKWSFHTQVYFLGRRARDHGNIIHSSNSCVQDRSIYEDVNIFARVLHQQGNFPDRDYDSYKILHQSVIDLLQPPDLIVYLKASSDELVKRIQKRDRGCERDIPHDYLNQLNTLYDEWCDTFSLCPILIINSDKLNFVTNEQHLNQVIQKILARLQQCKKEKNNGAAWNN